jgi:hypothetical protein
MESTFSHYASISSSDSETEVNSSSSPIARNDVFYARGKVERAHQGFFDTSINSPSISSASSFEPFLPSFCWSRDLPVSSTATSASMSYTQEEGSSFTSDAAGKDVLCECLECDSSFINDTNLSLLLEPFDESEEIEEEGDQEEAFPLSLFEKNHSSFLPSHESVLPSKRYLFPSHTAPGGAHGTNSSQNEKVSFASPKSSSSYFPLATTPNRFIGASPFPLPPRTSFKNALEAFEARLEVSKSKSPYSHLASSSSRSGLALTPIKDDRSAVDESIINHVEDEQAFPACQCGCESTFSPSSITASNEIPRPSIQGQTSRHHFASSPLTGLSKSIWSMASPTVSPRKLKKMISFPTCPLDLLQYQSDIVTAPPLRRAQDAFLLENPNQTSSQFPHGSSMTNTLYRPLLKRSISGYPQYTHHDTSSMPLEASYYQSSTHYHQDQTPFYFHHHHHRTPLGPSPNNKKGELYKTEMCRSFTEFGHCRYAEKCQFAHGLPELRPLPYGFMPSHHHGHRHHHHHSHSEGIAHRHAQTAMMPWSASAVGPSGWDSSHQGLFDKASYAAEHGLLCPPPGEAFLGRRRSVSSPSKVRMYSLRDPFDVDDVDAVAEPAEGFQRTSMFMALQAEAMNAPKPVCSAHL